MHPIGKEATILLVEDNEDDVFLTQRAIQTARLANPIRVVRDGKEALHYLRGEGDYSDREQFPVPFLILLDLHMPKVDGFEVLRWVKSQNHLSNIVLVVLTSSKEEYHCKKALALGADSYFIKPGNLEEFVKLMFRVKGHWLLVEGNVPLEV
jgi:CheY-like chemotaxis protein